LIQYRKDLRMPVHPNSLANLCPAAPGEARNPEGRNGATYRREAERFLDEMLAELKDGRTRAEAIIDRVMTEAEKGRPWAAKLIFERALPVAQRHQINVEARHEPRSPLLTPTEKDERELVEAIRAEGAIN
jgi:hypothetical protein